MLHSHDIDISILNVVSGKIDRIIHCIPNWLVYKPKKCSRRQFLTAVTDKGGTNDFPIFHYNYIISDRSEVFCVISLKSNTLVICQVPMFKFWVLVGDEILPTAFATLKGRRVDWVAISCQAHVAFGGGGEAGYGPPTSICERWSSYTDSGSKPN